MPWNPDRSRSPRPLAVSSAVLVLASLGILGLAEGADDWPMWRHDPGRTGASPLAMPEDLDLLWVRNLDPLAPAWRNPRLGFDHAVEPVAAGDLIFVGSNRDDSVSAFDAATGELRWRTFAGGPVRFAPAIYRDRLFVASDDGFLYALRQDDGRTLWKYRAAPSMRRVLGNGRLISAWPVRGGPVVAGDTVYFAAGVWSFEGVFVAALDAETGEPRWINDRTGYVYGAHPHGAEAFGGLTPQGYLVVSGDELIVPCGTAYPARFDRATGALIEFALPRQARYPGGWFAALDPETERAIRHGELAFDSEINSERHEDNLRTGEGAPGLRRKITLAGREVSFDAGLPGVEGEIGSVIAAGSRIFATTKDGRLWALGAREKDRAARKYAAPGDRSSSTVSGPTLDADLGSALERAAPAHGYALVLESEGENDTGIIERLLATTELHIVVASASRERVETLRESHADRGLHGTRIAFITSDERDGTKARMPDVPRWMWSLIVVDPRISLEGAYELLRPWGGRLLARANDSDLERFRDKHAGAEIERRGEKLAIVRRGALRGASNYLGGFEESRDELVRAPLGVLWYDDETGHFKRSPQPIFIDGVMVSRPKIWEVGADQRERGFDYELAPRVFTDMYTGRRLDPDDAAVAAALSRLGPEKEEKTPVQYRPESQKDAWNPAPPQPGERVNPLTGKREPRVFPKSYGCDGGIDYGYVFTMRSGTAAFYDLRSESGTIHLSGPRSGCTNSIIPAGGLLNVPYFYEGCTCSYPLPSALALFAMPPEHEQWSAWGASEPGPIERTGINFGAPGDRIDPNGTLWLEWPPIGGPSPAIRLKTDPDAPETFYRHSIRTRGGDGWPWVIGSGVRGVRKVELTGLRPSTYRVRLFFAEPGRIATGERVFDVLVNGKEIARALDPAAESKTNAIPFTVRPGIFREATTSEPTDAITVELVPRKGETILCGLEIIATDLEAGKVPAYAARSAEAPSEP